MSTQPVVKKKTSDFKFGKLIGEGSFSEVYLVKEISTNMEYAIKVLLKKQILKEKKEKYVHREKEVLLKLDHPFFIKLHFTFQDEEKLYFGLSYACNGELLNYIKRLGKFDVSCAKFYSAEIVTALEYLHSLNIIHRDMKPENILLNKDMHIQITDFGSAKIVSSEDIISSDSDKPARRHSFVGTAQYVSPEVLNSFSCFSSDLWAFGCILYQFLTGCFPFRGGGEYQIFQKIIKLDYNIPVDFDECAKDLVENLLVLDPKKRIGCQDMGGYEVLKSHSFFKDIIWETLSKQIPPLASVGNHGDESSEELMNSQMNSLEITGSMHKTVEKNSQIKSSIKPTGMLRISPEERDELLKHQVESNIYHKFVHENLIIKQGLLDKRKGLRPRRRMFLLTEGPHLIYVDPVNLILKGEIPWTDKLKVLPRSFKEFFVQTPNRTYYLEDPDRNADSWCSVIEEVAKHYFPSQLVTS